MIDATKSTELFTNKINLANWHILYRRGGLYKGWGSGNSKNMGEINNYKWPNELTTLLERSKYWLYDDIE